MTSNTKIVILYRVIQEWRRPVFERLSQTEGIDLNLFHGPDFEGSKVVSTKKKVHFKAKKLFSFKIRKQSKNGLIAMPVSPFLFFTLIRTNPEVVITEGASNLFNALVGFIYCKIFGKKFIWWSLGKLKGTEHTGFRKKIDSLIQYMERNSNAIISYSTLGKTYFESIGVKPENIFVAVNVVDTATKLKELQATKEEIEKKPDDIFTVLSVGALTQLKKIDLLIKSFSNLEQEAKNVKLIIVGGGPERQALEDLAKKLQIKSIEFTGKVFDGVSRYFLNADVFVLPGLGGLAVSEAMFYGLPVIASIGDGCEKDLISHQVDGIIDEDLDEKSLTDYLSELNSNPVRLEQMKQKAKQKIEEKYNIHTYLDKVVAAIQYAQKN